jgi:hypothetical protein
MHQYALLNKGQSIHSPCQFESHQVTVDDKSVRAGGTQRIQTPDGYTIPLTIKDGLARLAIRPYTDQEYETLPHVFLTAEANWDPSTLDHEFNSVEEWFDATQRGDTDPAANRFDDVGNYRRRVAVQKTTSMYHSYNLDMENDPAMVVELTTEDTVDIPPDIIHDNSNPAEQGEDQDQDQDHPFKPKITITKEPNYVALRPKFGWLSADIVSLIGALQWVITIGQFDVHTAVMTLSGFRVAPRRGHLERVRRFYGYLSKMRHAAIRIRTEEPDYSDIPDPQYDWSRTVYGELQEDKPKDAPKPLGKMVTLTHYVDANLMHDVVTGRSVTGILHLMNKTPMDWYA